MVYHLHTGIVDCKSCHTIETFELIFSFFSLYHLQVKFMFTNNRLLMEKRNAVKMGCMKQFLHTYLECLDICVIKKTFLSVLLNLH